MQLSHALTKLEAAVDTQLRIAGPEIAEAGQHLMAALRPAISQTMMEVVTMAVAEVASQMESQVIDIKLVDGDPELSIREDASAIPPPPPPPAAGDTDDEARITVRLPGYLKDLISAEAEISGDSINSYVVDLLNSRARRKRPGGAHTRTTLEL